MDREQDIDQDEAPEQQPDDEFRPQGTVFRRAPNPDADPFAGDDAEDASDLQTPPQFLKQAAAAVEEAEELISESGLPRQPRNLADLGLSKAFLTDLTLKIIHYAGTPSAAQLMRRLGLGQAIVRQILTALGEEHLVEVLSQSDLYTGNYRYRLSERGSHRAGAALERSRYAGPAPVTAEQYAEVMRRQHALRQAPGRARIKEVLNEMVLAPAVADAVARALYSGKSAILYGPSGNGKTSILERFARNLDGTALVPYAIYAYGQVIRVFDQSIHEPLEELEARNVTKDESKMDRRWVLVRRPTVIIGAEIGLEALDLAYDPGSRFYQAPPHIKAQGGVLIIDDFGRQKISAKDLLTRWLIPLERGWDTLALVTGEKVSVPFSVQVLFGTNLNINQLADDALLRRILYKVKIPNPRQEDFAEILRQLARQRRVLVSDGALDYIVERLFSQPAVEPRASHARDLLDMVIESAAFDGRDPVLDRDAVDRVLSMSVAHHDEEGRGS
ncbi:MAG TPA: hypothetical protein VFT91_04465 [Dehalococcoidia bacterium]|nr:hypothetical protein [Dehalococcoidia bacterium]